MRRRMIRCYAEGREGQWEAFCVDFDLAVQGESLEEVVGSLNEAVKGYLEYVSSLPSEEQEAFLKRRAPFGVRFKFLLCVLFALFGPRGDREGKGRAEFTVPAGAAA